MRGFYWQNDFWIIDKVKISQKRELIEAIRLDLQKGKSEIKGMSSGQDRSSRNKNQAIQDSGYQREEKRVKSFTSPHNNRLGGLIFHPEIIPEHKEMLQKKMQRVVNIRKFVEYTGGALFVLHMLGNRLKVTKVTGVLIVVPPVVSYLVKLAGYMWVDNYAYKSGMYKMYRISTL